MTHEDVRPPGSDPSTATSRVGDAAPHDDPWANGPPLGTTNQNPRDIGLLALLREDFETHDKNPLEAGFWALAVHRLGNARMSVRPRALRVPLSAAYQAAYYGVLFGLGIKLDYTVEVGRRVRIWHHGGMILGARRIGNDVHIRQNTTFGVVRRDQPYGKPVIEDGVDIGCGVAILGPVRIGRDTTIGANTVVVRDVPPGSVVVGASARVWPKKDEASEPDGSRPTLNRVK